MMTQLIHSIIEFDVGGHIMKHKKHKKHQVDTDASPSGYCTSTHNHHHKSEVKTDKNRFFQAAESKQGSFIQTTTVNVNVDQPQENCITSCFNGLARCFGRGGA